MSKVSADEKKSSHQPLRFKTNFRNTIYEALKERGWKETEGEDWDLNWAERDIMYEVFDTGHFQSFQRINHFRNDRELCRKDLLAKNLKKRKRQLIKENDPEADNYDFWPTTYVLPGDYPLFVEEFKRSPEVWIMKPISKSQGKGIFMFTKLQQINKWKSDSRWKPEREDAEAYVVQKYIMNPFCVGGQKFDMRLYALCTSYTPLNVWFYRSGFCRFSSQRYDPSDLDNEAVHLTNVAIQKKLDTYDSVSGGKWEIRGLKMYLMSRYGIAAVDKLFHDIQMIIIRSLQSVQQVMISDKHCFELYGFDIMFDDNFKPWLIEVNASPSLTANTPEDRLLKIKLLTSVMDIVDLEGAMKGNEVRVGGFDLIVDAGQIRKVAGSSVYSCMLGAEIPRENVERKPRDEIAETADQTKLPTSKRTARGGGGEQESKESRDKRTNSRISQNRIQRANNAPSGATPITGSSLGAGGGSGASGGGRNKRIPATPQGRLKNFG